MLNFLKEETTSGTNNVFIVCFIKGHDNGKKSSTSEEFTDQFESATVQQRNTEHRLLTNDNETYGQPRYLPVPASDAESSNVPPVSPVNKLYVIEIKRGLVKLLIPVCNY